MSAQIDKLLRDAVATSRLPNAVAVAADRNGTIYEGAAGPRAVGGDNPVTPDSHFRIMSMTKIVCTVAALQQVERGSLELAAPVDTYCAEFADLPVLEGFDGDTPRLRPAGRRATVRHLITHTSGLGYPFFNEDLMRWRSISRRAHQASTQVEAFFKWPLLADPGTRFIYGTSTDWLGKVVEAVSGQSLDVYLEKNVTGPLGMNDTAFMLTDEQKDNLVPVHRCADGVWSAVEAVDNQPAWYSGGHGLYSTPHNYLRFQRMLLGNGTLEGTTILRSETVDAAFTNQIGQLEFPPTMFTTDPTVTHPITIGSSHKWGYGLLLNTQDIHGMRQAWSGSWAGICNTYFWVDRTTGIAGAIYSQFYPGLHPDALDIYANFEHALYASR